MLDHVQIVVEELCNVMRLFIVVMLSVIVLFDCGEAIVKQCYDLVFVVGFHCIVESLLLFNG